MKQLLFTLLLALTATAGASAQRNTIDITLKDGTVLSVQTDALFSTEYAAQSAGTDSAFFASVGITLGKDSLLVAGQDSTLGQRPQPGYLVLTSLDGYKYTLQAADIEKMAFSNLAPPSIDRMLYVIGYDIGEGNWEFNVPYERIPLYTADQQRGLLTYTGYFKGDGFKLVGENWGENYGGYYGGFLQYDGPDIEVPEPGYYTVWFDMQGGFGWMEEASIVPGQAFGSIGLIGTFCGWTDEVRLQRVPGTESHDWYCYLSLEEDSHVKFRADGEWAINWGGADFPSGPGYPNGQNISVKAGDYIVLFNDLTGHYHFYDPQNPAPLRYQPETYTDAMTLTPGVTSIDFATYDEERVQVVTAVDLPLVVDYFVSYQVTARYAGNAYYLSTDWNNTAGDNFGTVMTDQLRDAVQWLCGRKSIEREVEIEVKAFVTVNGFPETYQSSITVNCQLPPVEGAEYVYFIGATDGWANAEQRLYAADGMGVYTGYLYIADPNGWGCEFKFQQTAGDWDTQLNYDSFSYVGGDFAQPEGGSSNIAATAGEGVYYVELDLHGQVLRGHRIYNMNLVGDYNGWEPADDTQQMTWDAEHYCFVMTDATVTDAGWKFAANNSWTINLGGLTIDELEANGANLTTVGTTIRLYPTRRDRGEIYCTVE